VLIDAWATVISSSAPTTTSRPDIDNRRILWAAEDIIRKIRAVALARRAAVADAKRRSG
jgi:hypothetical protein